MKILFIVSAFNGLSQRAWLELDRLNHQVKVHVLKSDDQLIREAEDFDPNLIIAPYLKQRIPSEIYSRYTCLIVHPGIPGDRGSSSLDWAILRDEKEWGVTILKAVEKMDAGPVWAYELFPMRNVPKAQLYRHEVTHAAAKALFKAVQEFERKNYLPEQPINPMGKWNRATTQMDFEFRWTDSTDDIIRKLHASDSCPGVLVQLGEEKYFAFGAYHESTLKGKPGAILAHRSNAICVATGDGALWLTHLKHNEQGAIKLPATIALPNNEVRIPESICDAFDNEKKETFREIWYEESNGVGYINVNFYNGAMSTRQCRELKRVFDEAAKRKTRVIVLMGGMDLWSNGIHLNLIEASENPAEEAWKNINAIDDLIETIIRCDTHYVISAMQGNAGAGGVPFALAADKVIARKGIVLNPHTRNIGLYGSEYWTYLLPRRIGTERAKQFTEQCLPWGTELALEVKLIDACIDKPGVEFVKEVKQVAEGVAAWSYFDKLMQGKRFKRNRDESFKPLHKYREEELAVMWKNIFEDDEQFDLKRHLFVQKKHQAEATAITTKDLFSERRKIWRRRKYEGLYYIGGIT